jgi:hypothetical protein
MTDQRPTLRLLSLPVVASAPPAREPHCPEDTGGSHYHCGRCGRVSSMQGHYSRMHGDEWHFCCPGDCELDRCDRCDDPASCCMEHRNHAEPPNPHVRCILR